MEQKYFAFNKKLHLHKNEEVKKKENTQEPDSYLSLANYLSLGYYIVTPLLVGVFFGLIGDNFLKSEPRGVMIGLLIGTIATFYNLFKLVKKQ